MWVDVTTVGPATSRELAERARAAGVRFVDAPVLGSTPLAEPGELTTVVGGADEDVERVRPLLQTWCADGKIVHVGPVGSGSALKLVVNQSLGAVAAGLGEALGLADHLGLPQGTVLDVLSAGAYGWTLGQKRPMIESGDFSAATFSLSGLAKDLGLVVDAAGDRPVPLTARSGPAPRTPSTRPRRRGLRRRHRPHRRGPRLTARASLLLRSGLTFSRIPGLPRPSDAAKRESGTRRG